ncbi:MAG TPA: ATP-dependent DNA ligase [Acidobacteriaceae bacterium]
MALFHQFAELCDALAATTKKLEKRALIADYLHSLPVHDAGRAALWLAGAPFAETDPRVLNIGGALLQKAIAQLAAATPTALSSAYRRTGDIGAAAADLLYGHAPDAPTLALADIETAFAALAEARGPAPKLRGLLDLLARATPVEAKYLIKLVTGDMRTGVKQSLVEEAIAETWPPASATATEAQGAEAPKAVAAMAVAPAGHAVRRASMLLGDLREVVALATLGRLADARMKLFHPLGFMLASPVQSTEEAIARFTEEIEDEIAGASETSESADSATGSKRGTAEEGLAFRSSILLAAQTEDKYDGIRSQLHVSGERVVLYSRNREDLSASFPELTEAFAAIRETAILDGEILAWNPAIERALPFATLQQRLGRKHVTAEMRRHVPVVLVVFDILYRDGTLLLDEPLTRRRAILEEFCARWSVSTTAAPSAGQSHLFEAPSAATFARLVLAPATRLASAEDLDRAWLEARVRGNEGVMIKSLASLYQPGRRGLAWLKLKRELATLDVVVTGVEYGNGRRAAVLSDYTFAIRDPDAADAPLKNVGKACSGLTDQEIADMTAWFKAHTLVDFGHFRTVEPHIVLEVAFNNVMRSTRHASGFALRFPRILRIRQDKPVEEIDTLQRVEEIYRSQPDKPMDEPD